MNRWIPVLVRAEHVEAVSRFIVELEMKSALSPEGTFNQMIPGEVHIEESPISPLTPGQSMWSKEDLKRLAVGSTATTARWARAMDVCAENPGTFLPTTEIANRSGMTLAEWRDAPRKISRHLKAHFPNVPRNESDEPVWPLLAKSRPEYPGQVSWAISEDTARIWKEIRA